MSDINNELILESIYEQVLEEYPEIEEPEIDEDYEDYE